MDHTKAMWLLKAAKSDLDAILRNRPRGATSAHQKWFVDEQLQVIYDDAKRDRCIIDVHDLDNPVNRRVEAYTRFMERACALFCEHGLM